MRHGVQPIWRARENTRLNFSGGLPRSDESSPMPMRWSSQGCAASSICKASSSGRWRSTLTIQPTLSPSSSCARLRRLDESRHEHLEADAAHGMALRIEKRLHAHHMIARGTLEIGPGQIEKILLGAQHIAPGVIQIEEGLEVG
jgi:hypothetical protein